MFKIFSDFVKYFKIGKIALGTWQTYVFTGKESKKCSLGGLSFENNFIFLNLLCKRGILISFACEFCLLLQINFINILCDNYVLCIIYTLSMYNIYFVYV